MVKTSKEINYNVKLFFENKIGSDKILGIVGDQFKAPAKLIPDTDEKFQKMIQNYNSGGLKSDEIQISDDDKEDTDAVTSMLSSLVSNRSNITSRNEGLIDICRKYESFGSLYITVKNSIYS